MINLPYELNYIILNNLSLSCLDNVCQEWELYLKKIICNPCYESSWFQFIVTWCTTGKIHKIKWIVNLIKDLYNQVILFNL